MRRKLTGRFYLYSSAYVPALAASLLAILWERKSRYVSYIAKIHCSPHSEVMFNSQEGNVDDLCLLHRMLY